MIIVPLGKTILCKSEVITLLSKKKEFFLLKKVGLTGDFRHLCRQYIKNTMFEKRVILGDAFGMWRGSKDLGVCENNRQLYLVSFLTKVQPKRLQLSTFACLLNMSATQMFKITIFYRPILPFDQTTCSIGKPPTGQCTTKSFPSTASIELGMPSPLGTINVEAARV